MERDCVCSGFEHMSGTYYLRAHIDKKFLVSSINFKLLVLHLGEEIEWHSKQFGISIWGDGAKTILIKRIWKKNSISVDWFGIKKKNLKI